MTVTDALGPDASRVSLDAAFTQVSEARAFACLYS